MLEKVESIREIKISQKNLLTGCRRCAILPVSPLKRRERGIPFMRVVTRMSLIRLCAGSGSLHLQQLQCGKQNWTCLRGRVRRGGRTRRVPVTDFCDTIIAKTSKQLC